MKKIVIIGAGYGGVLTAKKLAKLYKKDDDTEIRIIDKNPYHTMLTELHEVAAGRVEEDSIRISLDKVFAGRKVKVTLDTAKEIDFDKKTVICENRSYDYDRLVIASGSKPTYFGVKGAAENAFGLWSYEDAIRLKEHIDRRFRQAAGERNLSEKKRLLTFYVVGAGFTGVEMAGELAEYVPILCQKYEIEPDLVHVHDVDQLPRTVNILPEKISDKVRRRLEKMNVTVELGVGVMEVGPDYIDLKCGENTERRRAGTVIWTAGIESADIAGKAAKVLKSKGRGRLEADPYLRADGREDVFIVGDNLFYIADGEEKPVPQMVENCEQSAKTAAKNVAASLSDEQTELSVYEPSFHGVMVCVGGRYGVARVGTPKHMISLASFLAMFVKHFINIIYFIQVLGWNKIFSYVKHEFFTIRHHRSFLGGHFSNVTPSFLLVPLRVFLGMAWVFEGIMKIVEGWLAEPKLVAFFGGASAWYDSILNGVSGGAADAQTAATGAAADAVSSATGAAAETAVSAGTALINWDFFGWFQLYFVSGADLHSAEISDYAVKLNIPLMNDMLDRFVLSSDSMQVFMQSAIVIAEILIGLALIGGLLTFLSAGASLILQFMFVATTGLYMGTVWMVFAAIAVLIGGGHTFGLDYYVMPWLKKKWKRVKFVRKWYWYND
ncbi:NAD(P)/FAD-dependent oxidoreductase [Anaerovorax odorimutans]|uniref:NADH:ubiquinone reductase (non-electrogenic) n=1 Tax=Anaerovorax odorimutans TaxID=109327 RepID=A0ABT1RME0_9FIRM|nr:NAD(P)/FAD-dependent oxidoreductase [Anaerovorax odorimutans]MCQ4636344.1 NAD(P)/FAD-dependent oxidoreductase [Anaerovorax odorimutans]